jgi:predicted RNase H-like HicB family nuclease
MVILKPLKFTLAIEAGTKNVFGVVVPDPPGCFSAGDTVEDAFDKNTKTGLGES